MTTIAAMPHPPPKHGGVRAALRRLAPIALFVALPVAVVTTMFVAWIISFNKEAPAAPQPGPKVWNIYS